MAQRFKSTTFLLSFLFVVAMTGHATNIYDWLRVFDPLTGGLIFSATGDGIHSETVSATDTVSAATYVFSASEIPLYVGDTTTSDSGKALIYDATANSINLLPITDHLDFATVGSSLSFGDISDVSVEFAAEGWVPAWNAASEIWEATPAATSTETLLENYLPLAGGTMAGDISMATHTISDVSQVNGLTSIVWIPSATDSMAAGEMRFWVSE